MFNKKDQDVQNTMLNTGLPWCSRKCSTWMSSRKNLNNCYLWNFFTGKIRKSQTKMIVLVRDQDVQKKCGIQDCQLTERFEKCIQY